MPTNDFLPIATAVGAPVLTQAAWAAATPANGRGPGIVPKEYFNKAQRQSSVMAAAIGLFLNNQGQNALDDGNIPALAAAFAAALGGANAPAFFSLRSATGAALARSVILVPGTYQVALQSFYKFEDNGVTYDFTATQSGIVAAGPTVTVNSSAHFRRAGSSGYGRSNHNSGMAVGSLVVPTTAVYAMTMTAAVPGNVGCTPTGSILTCERLS